MIFFQIVKSFRKNEKKEELLRENLNQEFVLLVGCLYIIFQITNYSLTNIQLSECLLTEELYPDDFLMQLIPVITYLLLPGKLKGQRKMNILCNAPSKK